MRPLAVLDIECYKDYFLIALKNIETRKSVSFEMVEGKPLDTVNLESILRKYTIVTFNGNSYDIPVLKLAMKGVHNQALKTLGDDIIMNGLKPWQADEKYALPKLPYLDHIDLIEVAPGQASLKIYGGRLHSQRMQDLPIEHTASISPADRLILEPYCINDLDTTIELYQILAPGIKLRQEMSVQYGMDLRSKSDAQIAEAVIRSEIEKRKGRKVYKPEYAENYTFFYTIPPFVQFKTKQLNDVLELIRIAEFKLSDKGAVEAPKEIEEAKFTINGTTYQMGIGGLHSCEKTINHVADANTLLIDRDVTSYYPNIILNQRLYPSHLGEDFLDVYKTIVDRRVAAKRAGDKVTDAALKITINGSFGKFGSKWSVLFGPNLLIQTTITGQLALLMLIEALEQIGIPVVSANTDGIVIKCPISRQSELDEQIHQWEKQTGFGTEETRYSALYSRDVNNYIALKADGKFKTKGVFANPGLSKNPSSQICVRAAIDYLQFGVPVELTIRTCKDVRQFITIRSVTGGAVKDDEFLGKAVRWYYAKGETGTINYKKNGNKVPRSDGAKPLMVLTEAVPSDIDYAWYIKETIDILKDVGINYA
jgi:DNA polymerase elongation subunit (family B)